MNCHKGNNLNPMKHMLHIVLCCGLPMLIIFLLPFIAGYSPSVAALLGVIAPFICPVMMGGMFFMLLKGMKKSNGCENGKEDKKESL